MARSDPALYTKVAKPWIVKKPSDKKNMLQACLDAAVKKLFHIEEKIWTENWREVQYERDHKCSHIYTSG